MHKLPSLQNMSVMDFKIKVFLVQSTKNDWYRAVLASLVNTHSHTKAQCSALAAISTALVRT